MKKKIKKTPRQIFHQDLFNCLQDWAVGDARMPKKVLEAVDIVSDYAGDIAMGRRR